MNTHLAPLALVAILFAMPNASALEIGDGPGGSCAGVVDVTCVDATENCQPGRGCETTYRDCLVWLTYLDMTFPALPEPVCEDQPYG